MTIKAKPAFQSALDDDADASLIQPSHWNAGFDLSLDGPTKLIGKAASGNGAAEEIDCGTWFQLSSGVLVPKMRHCMVKQASDSASSNFTTATAVSFAAEILDPEGWHDNSTNPSRVTLPAGISAVEVTFQIQLTGYTAASGFGLYIRKNGALPNITTEGVAQVLASGGYTNPTLQVRHPYLPVNVAGGDYIEAVFQTSDTTTIIESDATWLYVRALH